MSIKYDCQIGDARLVIAETGEANKNSVSMKDTLAELEINRLLTDEECDKLIKEFEDPEGELGAEEGAIMKEHFSSFLP